MPPLEVVFRAAVVYVFLVLVFRLVPRKEFARISLLDIIFLTLITVALRRSVVGDDQSLTSAFVALVTILSINQLLHGLSRASHWWSDRIQGRRLELMRNGVLIRSGLKRAKVTEDDLMSRLRGYGTMNLDRVDSAYMERDGKVTFVFRDDGPRR
ncbi:MAG TPA: YetF domain-containing protein [Vulgatibacter sp.]|nr:YetF domain-containing protein [Vulgatibacter sp.]